MRFFLYWVITMHAKHKYILIKGLMFVSLITFSYFIIKNSTIISNSHQLIQNNQLQKIARTLTRQTALFAIDNIKNNHYYTLAQLTNNLADEPLIFDATIYNAAGEMLVSSKEALNTSQITGLNTPLSTDRIGRQQLVEPIIENNRLLGFLRITFEKSTLVGFANHYYRKSDRLMFAMLITSLISGMLLITILRPKK